MATMNISLPDEMKAWVEEQARTGRYSNSSDVMRDLVRRGQEREAAIGRLNALIQEGLDSGPAEPFSMEEFIARMREKHGVTEE